MAREKCGLKRCTNDLGPGSAEVGFKNDEVKGGVDKVRVCPGHAYQIMCAQPGTIFITPDKDLTKIPARQIFI